MKKIFLLSLITYPLFLSAQIDTTFNGVKKETYDDGKIKTETPYIKGRKYGTQNEYNKAGKLAKTFPYINDTLNGIAVNYYDSGRVAMETPYKNGMKDGVEKHYFKTGKVWYDIPYLTGKKNGISTTYFN